MPLGEVPTVPRFEADNELESEDVDHEHQGEDGCLRACAYRQNQAPHEGEGVAKVEHVDGQPAGPRVSSPRSSTRREAIGDGRGRRRPFEAA
jgi:hypothetical protein